MAPNPAYRRLNLWVRYIICIFYSDRVFRYTTRETYTFVPADGGDRSLTVNRTSGEIQVGSNFQTSVNNVDLKSSDIFGIIGIISLAITDYIVVMTGLEFKGELLGHEVFRATKFEMLPMNPDVEPELYPAENYLMGLLRNHLETGLFWFSYTWDLTRRLQAQWNDNSDGKFLWEVADDRFFWNKYGTTFWDSAYSTKVKTKIGPFILPLLFGTFDIRPTTLNGYSMRLCLISRRSRYRAGTRYFRRGMDRDGHVANFNETEQILLVDKNGKGLGEPGTRLSFVQVRGSVPLHWAEINNLRYKPELQIMELPDTETAMRVHLQELVSIYGESALVSLVNQKGHELPLKEAFERYIQKVVRNFAQLNLPKVRYEYFDFHAECSKMRWDRISLLIDKLKGDLLRDGYLQQGVIRTNCMDNLDRTNVAQSAIAKWMLNRQLRDIGILKEHESVDTYDDFMHHFRNMWADHADLISKAYSGTGALKTDYTRTGKRTNNGLLEDGLNSVMRYLKNNFLDGPRQDGFDLFTGGWTPQRGRSALGNLCLDTRPLFIRAIPTLVSLSLFMICAGLTLPRSSDYSLSYWFALWMSLFVLAIGFVLAHGVAYVSWPRLNPMTDLIEYNGPGFKGKRHGRGLGLVAAPGLRQSQFTKKRVHAQEIGLGTFAKKRVD
ncbi:uncharacterized protein FOMMEDRAFT_83474 [Fomitiporia mediterranea MF3/22]|uniref:uncharacterized protein n=1 Tax=Fomitiporia mediterranea (strain MF3/22) TaxID=694068 RepID=UPI000440867D|nr:uncharacterized protein FOMMEDRAFT_83474 [Fomitiporia mediterranea MF3/22]EJD04396.1 hypothetical protein FOMMEDRAFT_83474 [Fomitiporia mediterranea MF3/22]